MKKRLIIIFSSITAIGIVAFGAIFILSLALPHTSSTQSSSSIEELTGDAAKAAAEAALSRGDTDKAITLLKQARETYTVAEEQPNSVAELDAQIYALENPTTVETPAAPIKASELPATGN